ILGGIRMSGKAWRLAASAALMSGVLGASGASAAMTGQVLSSMPQLVTGGDALLKVSGTAIGPVITVEGKDVTSAFKADGSGNYVGLVTGLKDGSNELVAKAGVDQPSATLVNHAINDTLFAGPQQTPYVCENESFELAAAKDASCAAPITVKYYYLTKANDWIPFDPSGARPADIATTTTSD